MTRKRRKQSSLALDGQLDVEGNSLVLSEPRDDVLGEGWVTHIRNNLGLGRVPLFVLGAGISSGHVPLLTQIGDWLQAKLPHEWPAQRHAQALAAGTASRREVAELFYVLQSDDESYREVWRTFSQDFLYGGSFGTNTFAGLRNIRPTPEHSSLASLLVRNKCYVMSLNFDGLTYRALLDAGSPALALHSNEELLSFFTARTQKYLPAIFKVRGDVFYSRCTETACPLHHRPHALDRDLGDAANQADLKCPVCNRGSLLLEFSFPGYRAKEEAAFPMLWTLRRFVGQRISSIVVIGLSGRWDRYLLDFLFGFAIERRLVLVDVKPDKLQENFLSKYQRRYYPWLAPYSVSGSGDACYQRVERHAHNVMAPLCNFLSE